MAEAGTLEVTELNVNFDDEVTCQIAGMQTDEQCGRVATWRMNADCMSYGISLCTWHYHEKLDDAANRWCLCYECLRPAGGHWHFRPL